MHKLWSRRGSSSHRQCVKALNHVLEYRTQGCEGCCFRLTYLLDQSVVVRLTKPWGHGQGSPKERIPLADAHTQLGDVAVGASCFSVRTLKLRYRRWLDACSITYLTSTQRSFTTSRLGRVAQQRRLDPLSASELRMWREPLVASRVTADSGLRTNHGQTGQGRASQGR
jgi:hypothetical protein